MPGNIVSDLLRKEMEGINKLVSEAGTPVVYFLSKDLDSKKKEILVFEKKISLANSLLAKINDAEQAYKLRKEKEDFEQKKISGIIFKVTLIRLKV